VFNAARGETAFDHFLPPSVELEASDTPADASGAPVASGWDPFLGRAIEDGVGTTPIGLAVSPDGERVYAANFLSRNVTVMSATRFACLGDPQLVSSFILEGTLLIENHRAPFGRLVTTPSLHGRNLRRLPKTFLLCS